MIYFFFLEILNITCTQNIHTETPHVNVRSGELFSPPPILGEWKRPQCVHCVWPLPFEERRGGFLRGFTRLVLYGMNPVPLKGLKNNCVGLLLICSIFHFVLQAWLTVLELNVL